MGLREVAGMGGVVDGGVVAGSYGYEAGQSGVGDIFAWFVDNCVPASYSEAAAGAGISVHEHLTALAARQAVGEHGLVALDWHSGNRSVLVDHELSGVIVGQTLRTRPEDQYRALIEATAFGTRTIIDTFVAAGVEITEVVAAGGLLKNSFLMQLYADVLGLPLATVGSAQGGALGSAIHGAVAAGRYPDVPTAARAMGRRGERTYLPNADNAAAYDRLYRAYTRLHDWLGREHRDLMHDLKALARGE
jgi:L-ribulokinase